MAPPVASKWPGLGNVLFPLPFIVGRISVSDTFIDADGSSGSSDEPDE